MEIADLILVNKSDGDLENASRFTAFEYMSALKYVQPKHEDWKVSVIQCSCITKKNLEKIWQTMSKFWYLRKDNGLLLQKRIDQKNKQMWKFINHELEKRFKENSNVLNAIKELEDKVKNEDLIPYLAAQKLIDIFLSENKDK